MCSQTDKQSSITTVICFRVPFNNFEVELYVSAFIVKL